MSSGPIFVKHIAQYKTYLNSTTYMHNWDLESMVITSAVEAVYSIQSSVNHFKDGSIR